MNKSIKKIFIILILVITCISMNPILGNKALAINQTETNDINSIDSNQYPQIKEMLQKIKNEHPNWNFKILYTDIDWSEAIANEYVGHGSSPRNLVPANNSRYDDAWKCKVCGDKAYDNGNSNCASEAAIKYMMDPRNSVNFSDIFQFMQLSYKDCNIQIIRNMVAGTFLDNESYINTIVDSAKKYNVNPYYVVARIIQEQGKSGSVLVSGNGYNGKYAGVYNVFNIGASGNGKENVILNGLKKAESYGWTSMEKSITGGVEILAKKYIARGQNTLYFQKFDVENSDGNLYWHQYMQNILAAQNEGSTLRKTFENVGAIDADYTFIIPLYKNMPSSAAVRPSVNNQETSTDLVKVNVTNTLMLRSSASKSAKKVGTLYRDEVVTRLNKATQKVDGTYWDYVMKADGTKGYAARETYESESTYKLYLVPVEQDNGGNKPDDSQEIVQNDKVKVDKSSKKVTTVPNATGNDLDNLIGGNVAVKNSNGQVINIADKLATGYTINDTYTVAVLGDVNGDGESDAIDLLLIKRRLLGTQEFDELKGNAADLNKDGVVDAIDLLLQKRYLLGTQNINI